MGLSPTGIDAITAPDPSSITDTEFDPVLTTKTLPEVEVCSTRGTASPAYDLSNSPALDSAKPTTRAIPITNTAASRRGQQVMRHPKCPTANLTIRARYCGTF